MEFTKEQEKRINEYYEEWLQISYSTQSLNEAELLESLTDLYAVYNLSAPKLILVDGPIAQIKAAQGYGDTRAASEIRRDLLFAPWELYWMWHYHFGLEIDPNLYESADAQELKTWIKVCRTSHTLLLYEHVVVAGERPIRLEVDDSGNLHSANGFALEYKDGTSIASWHGMRVPDCNHILFHPERITVEKIEEETNQEVRRAMIEIFGQERFIKESGAQIIHQDIDPQNGDDRILYRKEIPNDEPIVMVAVKNSTPEADGSIKEYFIRVPPYVVTTQEALAWTFNMKPSEYVPLVQT